HSFPTRRSSDLVDEDVDAAELLLGGVEQGGGGPLLGDVAADGHRAPARVGDGGDGVGGALPVAVVMDDDGGPVGGQAPGTRPADAAGAAGEDGDTVDGAGHGCPLGYEQTVH